MVRLYCATTSCKLFLLQLEVDISMSLNVSATSLDCQIVSTIKTAVTSDRVCLLFQKIMLEEGMTRLAIHSLTGSSEKEREHAIKLLLEFSNDEAYCRKIALEKGALVLLTSLAGTLEHPTLSNLAEEVLTRIETVEENIQYLAAAGRFEPLLSRLCEGTSFYKACLLFNHL